MKLKKTNYIVIDILKHIVNSDIAICDLSARNPNVLYELGIRQAFNKPVALIKDSRTQRIFDIQGLRDIEYDDNLRVDKIQAAIDNLAETLINTYENRDNDVNSVVQLLGINPAELKENVKLTEESSIILKSISNISEKITQIENTINLNNAISKYLHKDDSGTIISAPVGSGKSGYVKNLISKNTEDKNFIFYFTDESTTDSDQSLNKKKSKKKDDDDGTIPLF